MGKIKIKRAKEIWGVKVTTSEKAKRIGLSLGAAGLAMGGAGAFPNIPSWIGISGYILMAIGGFVANLFKQFDEDDSK